VQKENCVGSERKCSFCFTLQKISGKKPALLSLFHWKTGKKLKKKCGKYFDVNKTLCFLIYPVSETGLAMKVFDFLEISHQRLLQIKKEEQKKRFPCTENQNQSKFDPRSFPCAVTSPKAQHHQGEKKGEPWMPRPSVHGRPCPSTAFPSFAS